MTTTFDPHDPTYLDEADVRGELTRTFEVCGGCRACVDLCPVFPTLFDLLDGRARNDPGLMTPVEQDTVVDACYHCNRCAADCPYTPDRHAAAVDVPRLVVRTAAMRMASGQHSILHELTAGSRTRTAGLARLSDRAERPTGVVDVFAAMVDRLGGHRIAVAMAAPSKRERFSAWFARHTPRLGAVRRGRVGVFPTCLVEYQATRVGRDLVRVFEHTGIECRLSGAGCCGAPWLHAGDVDRFRSMADQNVAVLAREIRSGELDAVVVAEPTCRMVMAREYATHVDPSNRADAELVVDHLADPSAHLLRACSTDPDTDAETVIEIGEVLGAADRSAVAYHVACHARADGGTSPGLELVRVLASDVTVLDACTGIGGRWDGHAAGAAPLAGAGVEASGTIPHTVVVGDCSLANQAIGEALETIVVHPMSYLARRYGLAEPEQEQGEQ